MFVPTRWNIGAEEWAGLSKVVEECGELIQVAGKLMAIDGQAEHWDGTNLHDRLNEELADVMAACRFFIAQNQLEEEPILDRVAEKMALFRRWQAEQEQKRREGRRERDRMWFRRGQ